MFQLFWMFETVQHEFWEKPILPLFSKQQLPKEAAAFDNVLGNDFIIDFINKTSWWEGALQDAWKGLLMLTGLRWAEKP